MTDNILATSGTVSHDQVRSASFRVVWMKTLMVDGRDCDGIDAVRITVKVTLVVVRCPVSTRVNENGAFPATSVGDTVHDGLFYKITRRFHRLSVIRRSPAAAKY